MLKLASDTHYSQPARLTGLSRKWVWTRWEDSTVGEHLVMIRLLTGVEGSLGVQIQLTGLSGTTLECVWFLWTCPFSVSTIYDLGVLMYVIVRFRFAHWITHSLWSEWHRKFETLPLKFVFSHVCVSPANLKTKPTWGRLAMQDVQLLTIWSSIVMLRSVHHSSRRLLGYQNQLCWWKQSSFLLVYSVATCIQPKFSVSGDSKCFMILHTHGFFYWHSNMHMMWPVWDWMEANVVGLQRMLGLSIRISGCPNQWISG